MRVIDTCLTTGGASDTLGEDGGLDCRSCSLADVVVGNGSVALDAAGRTVSSVRVTVAVVEVEYSLLLSTIVASCCLP